MALASAAGAVIGGVLAVYVAGSLIKATLGVLLIWSGQVFQDAWRVAVAPANTPLKK